MNTLFDNKIRLSDRQSVSRCRPCHNVVMGVSRNIYGCRRDPSAEERSPERSPQEAT